MRREVTRYIEPGHWFLSLYNDDGDTQEVTFFVSIAEDMTRNCPNGCSGNGQCLLGHCQCNPGFGGDDCSESEYFFKLLIFKFTVNYKSRKVLSFH
jgi:teneurin